MQQVIGILAGRIGFIGRLVNFDHISKFLDVGLQFIKTVLAFRTENLVLSLRIAVIQLILGNRHHHLGPHGAYIAR